MLVPMSATKCTEDACLSKGDLCLVESKNLNLKASNQGMVNLSKVLCGFIFWGFGF